MTRSKRKYLHKIQSGYGHTFLFEHAFYLNSASLLTIIIIVLRVCTHDKICISYYVDYMYHVKNYISKEILHVLFPYARLYICMHIICSD